MITNIILQLDSAQQTVCNKKNTTETMSKIAAGYNSNDNGRKINAAVRGSLEEHLTRI